ncbi:hypothetical protein RchiOBHm_Chr6g0277161 [Rosa chinensis]|uniref:Uncharacterized protein n=1 Tax=Rosa chinensis TaxID=74649 RepID=A0A2P6PSH1_ROSCH|nr:hypothetical protein RchiOBHm_Chr6g0277161 [Rosa chinensis]
MFLLFCTLLADVGSQVESISVAVLPLISSEIELVSFKWIFYLFSGFGPD